MESRVSRIALSIAIIFLVAAALSHALSGKILFLFLSVYAMRRLFTSIKSLYRPLSEKCGLWIKPFIAPIGL